MQFPVFIVNRNILSWLRDLIAWLEAAGQNEIYIVDNDSTYPPLLEFYKQTKHTVLPTGGNLGTKAPWVCGHIGKYAQDRYYAVTDMDVIPHEDCPLDALDFFYDTLRSHSNLNRVGFSLLIDDLPEYYDFRKVVQHEHRGYWMDSRRWSKDRRFFDVPIDMILGINRPNNPKMSRGCLRADRPYVARHMSWYINSADPGEEVLYYREHGQAAKSYWSFQSLPRAYRDKVLSQDPGLLDGGL